MDYKIGRDLTTDEFFQEGMRLMEDERIQRGNHLPSKEAHVSDTDHAHEASHDIKLLEGRLVRERLKRSPMSEIDIVFNKLCLQDSYQFTDEKS